MDFYRIMYFLVLNMMLLLQPFMTVNIFLFIIQPITGLRPLREIDNITYNEGLVDWKEDYHASFPRWNITGVYKGSWKFINSTDSSSTFPYFRRSSGSFTFDLISIPTEADDVHCVEGVLSLNHVSNEREGVAQIKVKGEYTWPDKYLQAEVKSVKDKGDEDNYTLLHPYHLLEAYASHVFQDSFVDKISPFHSMECNLEIRAQVSKDEDHDQYNMEGVIESPSLDGNGDCFPQMLLNATSVEIENYSIKAIKYTLMVTFITLFEIYLTSHQMEYSHLQVRVAYVSIWTISHQAIMDTYVCLLHVVAGYLVGPLFDGFAVVAILKYVLFSIFEMKYILAIWHTNQPTNNRRSSVAIREEDFHCRFYMMLVGGIFIMFVLQKFLPIILLTLHSFWIPQIITNVIRNTRKPLHLRYIIGMSISRLSIPLYIFGCPYNFVRAKTQMTWCIYLGGFMSLQISILLVQNYLGSRCFLPDQLFPPNYNYYRSFSRDAGDDPECVICMSAIDISQRRSRNSMVTPCNHFFHYSCLQEWMDIKMECPSCRRPLSVP